ncbi:peptidyl-prolyl cis-trans isomerase [Actinophytocola xinjiangensis]|uniref:Peptidyl-prolyl cis-trans isomerase n=1 Tax=Actinophytocola xinjiangensis TaxID=485602 RepID=A0A7Z0WR14_9PSEU|nr:peptidylprolyl isomerase [Actinophytocola xinjiangensis]OLF13685.1 peptidyl-prolyl cis-trans isomerase [Actinophytocola xinjiangensis]
MPSNEQRRQAAKRKLERQLTRRAERVKRRRIWGVGLTVIVVVAVVGLVYWLANLGPEDSEAATNPTEEETAPANTTDGSCAYTENPAEQPPAEAGLPDDPAQTPSDGTVKITVTADQGVIPLTLDRALAPCTVQSIEHLAKAKYFDGTVCHRLTNSESLKVLQCGDPKGDGTGGPGYTIPDELPTDLADAPNNPTGEPLKIYPRGTLAMANGGPDTGGSQFFMVYGDSTLPPNYAVFGKVEAPGLTVLDKIAQAGITPGSSPDDGAPKTPVNIKTATVDS